LLEKLVHTQPTTLLEIHTNPATQTAPIDPVCREIQDLEVLKVFLVLVRKTNLKEGRTSKAAYADAEFDVNKQRFYF
jgi:hypothetical protein